MASNPRAALLLAQRCRSALAIVLALLALSGAGAGAAGAAGGAAGGSPARAGSGVRTPLAASRHTNNWAIIVCASRYWLNYRHATNAMAIYHTVKRLGIPDTHIIMMMADDFACNARNSFPGRLFPNESHALDVYGQHDVEVDYRGIEVTPEALLGVLTGRHDPSVPRSKRMLSDAGSNVLVYLTGHGGDGFLKFLDTRELLAQDLADALAQADAQRRYSELLIIAETCEAGTLLERIAAPRVITMGSSDRGEQSLAHRVDLSLGVSQLDRFTYLTLSALERIDISSDLTLGQLQPSYSYDMMEAHLVTRAVGFGRPLADVRLTDFFGGVVAAAAVTRQAAHYAGRAVGEATLATGSEAAPGGDATRSGSPVSAPHAHVHAPSPGGSQACGPDGTAASGGCAPQGGTPPPLGHTWGTAVQPPGPPHGQLIVLVLLMTAAGALLAVGKAHNHAPAHKRAGPSTGQTQRTAR